ncbi:GIY-YIG nuclease family protein [Candidatus Microgenomates bacterium]|nr:GIY-YIG nuclease family protein [Candidatus Microgenomates bacterium]
MKWYLYIVICRDGSLYTGITTNIKRRLLEHNSGIGAKSLLGKLPVSLVYGEVFLNQKTAAKREREIKDWKREYKLKLIKRGLPRN